MIRVHWAGRAWVWSCGGVGNRGYDTADHALRDARTWVGAHVPALIFPRRVLA